MGMAVLTDSLETVSDASESPLPLLDTITDGPWRAFSGCIAASPERTVEGQVSEFL